MRISFSRILRWTSFFFLIGVVLGCASAPPKPSEPTSPPVPVVGKAPTSQLLESNRRKAMEYEQQGEFKKALHRWQIVASCIPEDGEGAKRVIELQSQLRRSAEEHYGKGLSYYQKNLIREARKEFLLTLYYHPDHKEALNYLKNKLFGEEYQSYEVKKGDTLKDIALKNYNDPQKDFLIAYFNDLGKDGKLAPKMILKIPVLESSLPKSHIDKKELPMDEKGMTVDTKEILNKARVAYRAKEYREVTSISQKVLEYDPADKEAKELLNESYYQLGKSLSLRKRYEEALTMLNQVEPGYKDVRETIGAMKKQLAEVHYLDGVKYFTEEELEKAIQEWDKTLLLDPHHPKARRDIENARNLLKKLKEFK
jgi:tetratricopeptide (TPR) repeat protein